MGSEDFSAFQEVVPGTYIWSQGLVMKKKGLYISHHHPKFTVDEQALQNGVKLYVHGTLKILNLTYRG